MLAVRKPRSPTDGARYKAQLKNGIRIYTGDHAWKGIPPTGDANETKKWKDNEYRWCKNHEAWVMHDPKGQLTETVAPREKEGTMMNQQTRASMKRLLIASIS